MRARDAIMANLSPSRYDRELKASERVVLIPLPEMQKGEYSISFMALPAGTRLSMMGRGGFVRYDESVIIRQLKYGDSLWMSDTPSEIADMESLAYRATGNVLIAGLGLGILAKMVAEKPAVISVTIIEIAQEIVDMVSPYLPEKVRCICADFREWWKEADLSGYDAVILDIWGDISTDDLGDMIRLWTALDQRHKEQTDGSKWLASIWGLETLIGDVQDQTRGYDEPSSAAEELRSLEFPEAADWLEDNYSDDEYAYWDDEDEDDGDNNTDGDDESPWRDYEDDAVRDAFEYAYNLPT